MNANQITRRLESAGIATGIAAGTGLDHASVSRDKVTVYVEGDPAATDRLALNVSRALRWGGFRTAFGGWVFQRNFQPRPGLFIDMTAAGLISLGWTVEKSIIYNNECVEGWTWTEPGGASGRRYTVLGDWGEAPPAPEIETDERRGG